MKPSSDDRIVGNEGSLVDLEALLQPADLLSARHVLAVAPHPDDIEVGIGGTIALLAERGVVVEYLTLTDGGAGSADPQVAGAGLAAVRKRELQTSGAILGVSGFHWLDLADTGLAQVSDLAKRIATVIRQVRPDLLLSMDPWLPYEVHPDHRAAGLATADAFALAGFPEYSPEDASRGLAPHACPVIAFYGTSRPNTKVAIDAYIERKIAAILAHQSQFSGSEAEFMKSITQFQGATSKEADTRVTVPSEPLHFAELLKVMHRRLTHYNTQAEWM